MAPSQPEHTTQTTEVKLPPWVDKASQENYQFAQQIAAKPYQAYGGQTVAGQSPLTQQGYGMISSGAGNNQTGYNAADDLFDQAGKGINGLDRSQYMNPFQQSVINSTVDQSQLALQKSLGANADRAVAANAFGGSRGAMVDAATIAQNNKDLMAQIAGLNSQNYNQATSAMQGDVNSKLAAGSGLATNQTDANKSSTAQIAQLLTAGQADQQQNQQVLNDARSKWTDAKNYDVDRLNLLLSSLGMSPYGKTENTDKTTSPASSGTDWATTGLGVLSLIPALFGASDKTLKKNISKVKTGAHGIPVYKYNYKNEPDGTPKHVGPMAQDVEKKFPQDVIKFGGKKLVRKTRMAEVTNGG